MSGWSDGYDEREEEAALAAQSHEGEDDMAWGNQQQPAGNPRGGKPKYEHKQNRGSMFDNDHKESEKHPDFTGSINVEGVVYWISGWTGMTQDGRKRKLTLSVKRQDERPQESQRPANRPPAKW